ncbi:FHIPEP family type III secretion protein [Buchnera aphidicola]|uniref:FHIPEP family type III secretion protein n=1 Tax=Buchnera aphidicola TaxID=9 RepID=UPI0016517B57|nr:FHIPEP family type III secretion protein [Buchnera aphidicola]
MLKINWKTWASPIIIFMILSMMILPFPPFLLDILFTFNITMSIVVLMVSLFIRNTLEFSVFPTILLLSTLLRLSLNIASTRIILLHGHTGSYAAGNVIKAFGYFLVQGNFSVGIIIFLILVIINFIVITKGAGRIAEVSARFILDSMPGKQIAIDSDLNSGLINIQKAKIRRMKISQEANFYGSMDGASKFVRGDAIAGILIMIVNIVGGLFIGIIEHNMTFYKSIKIYTLLTIGDGLVAQIPALIISTAAGVIVTRVSSNQNLSEQIIEQFFYYPQVFILSSLFLVIFGLIPGMPHLMFLLFSFILMLISCYVNYFKYNSPKSMILNYTNLDNLNYSQEMNNTLENQLSPDTVVTLEIGFLLLQLINIDNRNNLFLYITELRKEFSKIIGFFPSNISISFNNHLSMFDYRILVNGITYGTGHVYLNKFLAIQTKYVNKKLGYQIIDIIPQYPFIWIQPHRYYEAIENKYDVLYPQFVIIIHLKNIMFQCANDLLGKREVNQVLELMSIKFPKLTEELVPKIMSINLFQKILYNLLLEHIPICDMYTIMYTLIKYGLIYKNIDELISFVRLSLKKLINQHFFCDVDNVYVIGLDPEFENLLLKNMHSSKNFFDPMNDKFLNSIRRAIKKQKDFCAPLIILVKHIIRTFASSFFRKYNSELIILSDLEISHAKKIVFTSLIEY